MEGSSSIKDIGDDVLSIEDEKDCEDFAKQFSSVDDDNNDDKSIIKGRIIKISSTQAMIDIGQKAERSIDIDEIKDKDGKLIFHEGDEIDIIINNRRLSHKQAISKIKQNSLIEEIKETQYKDKIIEITVVNKNRGGYMVKWIDRDVECFLPNRYSAMKRDTNYIGKKFKVCLVKVDHNGITVSRKRYFDVSNQNKERKVEELLKTDSPIEGKVVNVTNFGIFVNVDGIEGLVHASEMSHTGFSNPLEMYKVGDNVSVKVINFDKEKSKLSFSIKALITDPWNNIDEELKIGYVVKAVVKSIKPYGAFVDIGNDIEGFLHVTEISWDKNKKPEELLNLNQEIDVKIVELDKNKKRLRVSMKELCEKPFEKFIKTYKEGDVLTGKVATVTDFGAFIRFDGVDGLLHNEDLSWNKNSKCKNELNLGEKIEVKILKIDKLNEKISLTRKMLSESPLCSFSKNNNIGDLVNGAIVEIKDFGVFIKINEHIDALIKNEDLSPLKKEEIKIGDNVEACISNIDLTNNKIRLSVRKLAKKREIEDVKNFNNDEKITLGDVLKNKFK